jgi:hypothetical protein
VAPSRLADDYFANHTDKPCIWCLQVPAEAAAFAQVDKTFKDIMRRTHDRPNALQVCTH